MISSDSPAVDAPLATSADYRQALLAVRDLRTTNPAVWTQWVSLLTTHYAMPGHAATPAQLAAANRLKSPSAANLNYGKLAHAVASQLGYCPPARQEGKGDPMWWMTLSTGNELSQRDEEFQYTMHPQLAGALEAMRWVRPQTAEA